MRKSILSVGVYLIVALFSTIVFAQSFDFSAEIRPRFEHRQGYKTLFGENTKSADFISQRSRLNFKYKHDKLGFGMTLQNTRTWGDVSTLSNSDQGSSFHQAWASYKIDSSFMFKMGRQEIVYDDHRIFGNVGWAQQARSHDAFIAKYAKGNHKLDVGLALNANTGSLVHSQYNNVAGYKNFQYAWYHGEFNKLGVSFLFLNTGVEHYSIEGESLLSYMQTIGTRLTYKVGKLKANAAIYSQTGNLKGNVVKSQYLAGDISYKLSKPMSLGLGIEWLSGKANTSEKSEINSFNPLFGTNHKFNGWMDYFYVGNHGNSVGLTDVYTSIVYKKNKFSAKLIPHIFYSAANVYVGEAIQDSNLGTEIDLNLGYKLSPNVNVNVGYSMMFATETMEVLKGGSSEENNNWGWVMFTFKPKLFSKKVTVEEVQ